MYPYDGGGGPSAPPSFNPNEQPLLTEDQLAQFLGTGTTSDGNHFDFSSDPLFPSNYHESSPEFPGPTAPATNGGGEDVAMVEQDARPSSAAPTQQRSGSGSRALNSPASGQNSSRSPSNPVASGSGGPTSRRDGSAQSSNSGNGNGSGPTTAEKFSDKSCVRCRERRVRCDRQAPVCGRCRKRHESCAYPDVANFESRDEVNPDAIRIAELEAQLASVESSLSASRIAVPPPPIPSTPQAPHLHPESHANAPPTSFGSTIHRAVLPNPTAEESMILLQFLANQAVGKQYLGPLSVDWQMGSRGLADQLTFNLMDAALAACCSKMPAIKTLTDRIPLYKATLHALDEANQLAVAVLSALGARTSPHSALLGVPTESLSDGSATPELYLKAGERREKACLALEARADEICWAGRVISDDRWDNAQSLVALTQLLIFEEGKSKQGRFFMRNSLGMFADLNYGEDGFKISSDAKKSIATSLYANDATIAPRANKPCLISDEELLTYFSPAGVLLPDFGGSQLAPLVEAELTLLATCDNVENALLIVGLWVCGVQRWFAKISTARRPNAPSIIPDLHNLFATIDEVHATIQRLQQFLVNLTHVPFGAEGDPFAMDHYILLGVRADTFLVDLVNLIFVYLRKDRSEGRGGDDVVWSETEGDPALVRIREESELRVRKCLKLVAFYAQLYLSSQDKHVVYHLILQLDLLPNWTTLVCQKIGRPGGPTTEEFEVSDEELDWLRTALELACYFTPRAGVRLEEFVKIRSELRPPSSDPFPLTHHSPPDPRPQAPSPPPQPQHSPYRFNSVGFVTSQNPADDTTPLTDQEALEQAFRGESWMDLSLTGPWDGMGGL